MLDFIQYFGVFFANFRHLSAGAGAILREINPMKIGEEDIWGVVIINN